MFHHNLWVVMPVYNEEEAIAQVVEEWITQLMSLNIRSYVFCVINDGSTDNTLHILHKLEAQLPTLKVIDKKNTGHGQTCVYGYKLALEQGAEWVLQIDSDGQCDPAYLPFILKEHSRTKAVFGHRVKRDDGWPRFLVSRFVSLVTYTATNTWLPDANVPYRLMRADMLKELVYNIPSTFYLANILLSVLIRKKGKIVWVPIRFRERQGGTPSIQAMSFVKRGMQLFKQLRTHSSQRYYVTSG